MKKCEKFDEWTECEKRGCKGCYFEDNETLYNKSSEFINNKLNKEEN